MLKNFLKQFRNAIPQTLGLILLVVAILLCLTGCGTQTIVRPSERQSIPKTLLLNDTKDADDYCSEVTNWLKEVAEWFNGSQQTTKR